jgi:RHS repeat-associated protein
MRVRLLDRLLICCFALMLFGVAAAVRAQDVLPDFYKDPGIYPNRDYVNQHVSEHVDPFTGALQIHSTDVFLPGNGGFDLKVIRSYNSSRINPLNPADLNNTSLAGMGWTVHFGRVIRGRDALVCVNADNGTAIGDNPVIELPDGSRQVLAFTGLTSPLMLTTQRWRADCLNGTGLSVYSPDGVRYDMSQLVQEIGAPRPVFAWYTTRITDRNGNFATVSYASSGSPQISGVTTSDGRSLNFSYLDSGLLSRRIQSITNGSRTWTYSYTPVSGVAGANVLTQVTRPDAAQTAWRYTYNAIVGSDNANNYQLRSMTYPQGGAINYSYGYVYFDTVTNPGSRSVVVTNKNSSDGAWSFAYTPGNANVYDRTAVSTPAGQITYLHVGANYALSGSVWRIGLLVSKTIGSEQGETYTWGSQKISDENNLRQGAFPSRIDTEVYAPVLTERVISRNGAIYRTTYSGFDTYGNPTSIVEAGPNGGSRTTTLSYYINTGLWIIKQADDETTVGVGSVTRTWDGNGNLLSETKDGVTTSYTRFTTGDIQSITHPRTLTSNYSNHYRGVARNELHPEGVNVSRIVSDAGNVESETNGRSFTTTYSYDGLNRLTGIRPPTGNATNISYTATTKTATRSGLSETSTEDAYGRMAAVSLGGVQRAFQHDALGRMTFQSATGFTNYGRRYTYDILNRVRQITHADNSTRALSYGAATVAVRDERNFTTTYGYRAYGDPDAMHLMSIAAPVAAANVSIARNGRDLVTSVSQTGVARSFGYDARYYLTSANHPETGTTVYGRDDAGNMTSKRVGASGTTNYDYDGRNRLFRVTYPGGNPSQVTNTYTRTDKLASVVNAVATRNYSYDGNENLTNETLLIDGLTLAASYNYNGNDQIASINYPVLGRLTSFQPNVLGRPTAVTTPIGSLLAATYWPNGQISDIGFAGNSRVTYGQNVREWANSVVVKSPDGVTRVSNTVNHDVAGNVNNIADSVDAAYARTFAHDGINRLTTINGPWGSGAASYSGAGNITSYNMGSESRSYSYDPQNRLSSFSRTGLPTASYSYDVYGNASPSNAGYSYDAASNLRTTAAGQTNSYDGTNARVKVTTGSVTTYEFRSASGQLLAEWRKEPGFYDRLREHFHIAGKRVAEQTTDFIGADVRPAGWMFLQPDAGGSPLASTWSGGLLFKENYRPYGELLTFQGIGLNNVWFAGQKLDDSSLLYMGARYYDPGTGRFLSVDPKEVDPGDLHSLNRYAYANNNPYRYVDPDGHSPFDVAFLAYDVVKLGVAVYSGAGIGLAAGDVAVSIVGVLSPFPGTGQVFKSLRVTDKVVDAGRPATQVSAAANSGKNFAGGQSRGQRLRDLVSDDKVSSADRGWIRQELNEVAAGKKSHIRNPPGKDLAHERGRENAKGYGYEHANLQNRADHRAQHKLDDWGQANKERPVP